MQSSVVYAEAKHFLAIFHIPSVFSVVIAVVRGWYKTTGDWAKLVTIVVTIALPLAYPALESSSEFELALVVFLVEER